MRSYNNKLFIEKSSWILWSILNDSNVMVHRFDSLIYGLNFPGGYSVLIPHGVYTIVRGDSMFSAFRMGPAAKCDTDRVLFGYHTVCVNSLPDPNEMPKTWNLSYLLTFGKMSLTLDWYWNKCYYIFRFETIVTEKSFNYQSSFSWAIKVMPFFPSKQMRFRVQMHMKAHVNQPFAYCNYL